MKRERLQSAQAKGPNGTDAAPRARSPKRPGSRRRLLVLLLLGAALVGVAAWIRHRAASNPILRIPPVEITQLLPAVAKEIELHQAQIVTDPNNADAWGQYGLVLLAHGFRKEAGSCFAEAETLDPSDYKWSYYLGMTMGVWDSETSWHAFERAVEKAPDRVSVRLRLAEWLFDLRQLADCERHVELALKREPDSTRAALLKARLLLERGDAQAALEWATKAAASKQGNRRDVHELLARIHQRLGNAEAAAAEIEKTEQLPVGVAVWDDPEMSFGAEYLRDASMLNTLADISRASGDVQKCLSYLRRIVEAEPDNFIAREKLAATLVDVEQFDEAERFLDLSLRLKPDSPDLLFLRGRVYLARKENGTARGVFERAAKLKPDYDEAWAFLGRACLAAGDQQSAVTALQEARRLSPTEPDNYRLLAQALIATQQRTAAIDVLRQALALAPDNDALRQELIEALLADKQTAAAVTELEEAVKKAKNPRPFEELLRTLQGRPDSATPGTTTEKG